MKRVLPYVALIGVLFLCSASSPASDDSGFGVGLRYQMTWWSHSNAVSAYPEWTLRSWPMENFPEDDPPIVQDQNFDFRFPAVTASACKMDFSGPGLVGPVFSLNLTRWAFSYSVVYGRFDAKVQVPEAKLRYDAISAGGRPFPSRYFDVTYKFDYGTEVTRIDQDLKIAYKFNKPIIFFCGYQFICHSFAGADALIAEREIEFYRTDPETGETRLLEKETVRLNRRDHVPSYDRTYHGPTIGVATEKIWESGWRTFGSVGFLPMITADDNLPEYESDSSGWGYNLDAGIGYDFGHPAFYAIFSYGIQRMDLGKESDSTHGVQFTIKYAL